MFLRFLEELCINFPLTWSLYLAGHPANWYPSRMKKMDRYLHITGIDQQDRFQSLLKYQIAESKQLVADIKEHYGWQRAKH